MLNIVLKNKTLIKVYKYSIKLFKFLNRHLYILSLFSMISKFRKTNTYKVINWIIKIIVTVNVILASGLFLSLTDLQTPFDIVYNLYMDILRPYIDLIKSKFNKLLSIINSVDDTPFDMQPNDFISKQYKVNPPLAENMINQGATIDTSLDNDIDISFNFADLAFYAGIGFFAYFFLYLPGLNNVSPTELAQYNYLNQGLIEIKMMAKDAIINLLFGNSGGGGQPPVNPPVNPTDLPAADSSGISLTDARTVSPVDSHSPSPFNSPTPRTPRDLARLGDIVINSPDSNLSPNSELNHYFVPIATQEVSIQTDLTHVNIVKPVLKNTVDVGVQTINNSVNASVQADSPSKLLKSIQLLNDTEID
jgi:hypothetical protein